MVHLDGSSGEGGGQIIRTALALSLLTGEEVHITNVRARRSRPGLQRQHLMAVLAAAETGQATVDGATLGSQELRFRPGRIQPGHYTFDIGTAGSTTLVLQAILPPLMLAAAPSCVTIKGGTHNPLAPPVEFLQQTFAPMLERCGPRLELMLESYGFYPIGGGCIVATITPVAQLAPLVVHARGAELDHSATAVVGRLPVTIAERELAVVQQELGWGDGQLHTVSVGNTIGNALMISLRYEQVTEVVSSIGQRGKPAEEVAQAAVREAQRYLAADVPVAEHLADQLLLPLALAKGGSYVTFPPSLHTTTNIATIQQFLDVRFTTRELADGKWLVEL